MKTFQTRHAACTAAMAALLFAASAQAKDVVVNMLNTGKERA